jgi:predicted dithiol-disulfide oxidoreductase (DUF899 family)
MNPLQQHPVVSRDEWTAARKRHLAHEKELTQMHERLSAERRALPWVKVDEPYVFQTDEGERTLAQLFGTNSQLVVYHFMLAPGEPQGCIGCSFLTDQIEGGLVHLKHHDVSVVLVSRAPLPEIRRYQARMGWQVEWVSSNGSGFNYDFGVSFTPEQVKSGQVSYNYQTIEPWGEEAHGISVFYRSDAGEVFHTYSSYGRGGEAVMGAYALLDLTPKGRNEGPGGNLGQWVKRHDEYEAEAKKTSSCCG